MKNSISLRFVALAALFTLSLSLFGYAPQKAPTDNSGEENEYGNSLGSEPTDGTSESMTEEGQMEDTGTATTPTPAVKEFTVTAKDWEFAPAVITVNKGDTVRLKATSLDKTHGLAIPDFNVNARLEPGKTQTVEFVADKAGTFSYVCSVFCGEGHSRMKGTLIVK